MKSCDLVLTVTALACALSECCTQDELTILSVMFTQLGDTLATILTQEEICAKQQTENSEKKG